MTIITRTGLGSSDNFYFRHRTGYDGGGWAIYGGTPHSEQIDSDFSSACNGWINDVYGTAYYFAPDLGILRWMGEVGILVVKPNSWHASGRACDLTGLYFDGGSIDSNMSWRSDLTGRRKYVGMAASCRWKFSTVLGSGYPNHGDHVHFDNGDPTFRAIRTNGSPGDPGADALIVQRACNELNGAGIAVDGVWGSQTETAYVNLLGALNMKCYDPKTYPSHASLFLSYITRHGLANRAAGYWKAGC